jgi:pyruvate-formate lyase-activating enzyme
MPPLQFLSAALKAHGIRVLLETCGYFNLDALMKCLYSHLDKIYFDIKLYDAFSTKTIAGRTTG